MFRRSSFVVILAPLGLATTVGGAGVTEFTDRDEWDAAMGPFTTIGFTGFPNGTFISDQYAELGILFTEGNDSIFESSAFPNDGVGLDGNGDIVVAFDEPQFGIAADFPGFLQIELYLDGALTYVSNPYGGGGIGFFLGLVSTEPFDAAVIIDPAGEAEIDDLHFGIPGPPAFALIAVLLARNHGRRRS